jgi:hypothetical protein
MSSNLFFMRLFNSLNRRIKNKSINHTQNNHLTRSSKRLGVCHKCAILKLESKMTEKETAGFGGEGMGGPRSSQEKLNLKLLIYNPRMFQLVTDRTTTEAEATKSRAALQTSMAQIDEVIGNSAAVAKRFNSESQFYEISKLLAQTLRRYGHGIPRNASNAFFKGIEIFRFIESKSKPQNHVNLFDNASFPGDWIRSAKWYWRDVDWRANSLNSDAALGDRFGLWKNNPEKWMMSVDLNGDVTVAANREAIRARIAAENWSPTLYTSDLGFGCKDYYAQEAEHFAAHRGQVLLGLSVLAKSGVFLVKTFTMYNLESHTLLNYTRRHFAAFYIMKPETSKPDNSECYWIGIDYVGALLAESDTDKVYNADAAAAQAKLAAAQAKKITENVTMFRSHARPYQFKSEIRRWTKTFIDSGRT